MITVKKLKLTRLSALRMIFRLKKSSFIYQLLALSFIFGLLWQACSAKKSSDKDIVAQVGDRQIAWQMLWRSYHLNPRWGKGITHLQAYENQLSFLIDQKLFAQAALADGLDQAPAVINYLQFIKEKEMIKELYHQEVAARVEISDQEYQTAYQRSKRKVKLAFINTPDSTRARIYLEKLQFAPLEQIELLAPEKEQKGTTPMLTFGNLASELEEVVFDMSLDQALGPIRIDGKYMVVKLIDFTEDKFISEINFAEQKSKIRKIISNRKAGKISDAFIFELLKDKDIHIQPTAFWRLSEQFSRIISEKIDHQPVPIFLADSELQLTSSNLADFKKEVLVSFPDGQLTIGEFLTRLATMPAGLRPEVKMAPKLKKAIAVMVRNDYLAKRAAQKRLDRVPEVQNELVAQSDEFLSRVWLQQLQEKITVTTSELDEFKQADSFKKLSDRFRQALSDQQVADFLIDYKFTLEKIRVADSLRSVYPVRIDTVLLKSKIDQPEQIVKDNPVGFLYRELFQ